MPDFAACPQCNTHSPKSRAASNVQRGAAAGVLFVCVAALLAPSLQSGDVPAHERPFLMPAAERERILATIRSEEWAKAEHVRVKAAAEKGDGYQSAFLYALEGDAKYLPAARKWLMGRFGANAWGVKRATERLADAEFFKGGQVGIPEVYYDTDLSHLIGYDWVAKGLNEADRKELHDGLVAWARYKMRCMDRWTQTANLVFKPTCTVAFTGLVTQDQDCLDWGFRRTKPWGGVLGGYDVVLDTMLLDGGPWREAPIYPIAHEVLPLLGKMSWYRSLYSGRDWWSAKLAGGCSPKGLMDYYLDTAYPIERTGFGAGQVRVATYGDGATNGKGDLFLANPAGDGLNCASALIPAYLASGDPRYAAFIAMIPDYKPNLVDCRPLPAKTELPPAPSTVWPNYGLAMLRSDESPAYWTSGKSIAVFMLMSQGYGHDHRDKFSLTLHGAGRLLYPDYNAIQYENLSIGWTRCSPSHNTVLVDEQDTRNATPTGIRHEFSPGVKFLAVSASGVFEGVDQTRALLLTREYLLDLFHLASRFPHAYDYLIHSFGKAQPSQSEQYKPSDALKRRYWLLDNVHARSTDQPWSMDFVIREEAGARKGKYGNEWYDHTAAVRVTMAAEPGTLVAHGVWGDELAQLVAKHHKGAVMDRLNALLVRRSGRETVFATVHEPYAGADQPRVTRVTKLGESAEAIVVRVETPEFTDYAAVAFGPQANSPEHVVALSDPPGAAVAFRNYGYLRVARDGAVTARGGWTGWRLPDAKGPVTLNGQPAAADKKDGLLSFGRVLDAPPVIAKEPDCPLQVAVTPSTARMFERDRRTLFLKIKNTLKDDVNGRLEFELSEGLVAEPPAPTFGPLQPGAEAQVAATLVSNKPAAGRHTVSYRVVYRPAGAAAEIRTGALAMTAMVGPTLEYLYEHGNSCFLVNAPKYTAKLDMFAGRCRYLADDAGNAYLDGGLLFSFSDGNGEVFGESTTHAGTWPNEAPAHLTAHAYDRCRWQAIFYGDRIFVRMDRGWTQFERTHFTLPGKWASPQGAPQWRRIIAVDAAGKESDAQPGGKLKVAAAALSFPGRARDIAFQFQPPQEIAFNGLEMKFEMGSLTNDGFSIGFCKPDEFDAWRGK
jgi:hypothetical protein